GLLGERAVGCLDELGEPLLGGVEDLAAGAEAGDAFLVPRDRRLERERVALEVGDDLLERREVLLERGLAVAAGVRSHGARIARRTWLPASARAVRGTARGRNAVPARPSPSEDGTVTLAVLLLV